MPYQKPIEDFSFLVLGAVTPLAGTFLGVISTQGLPQTIFLAAVGAAIGWMVKVTLDWLLKKLIRNWKNRKNTSEKTD